MANTYKALSTVTVGAGGASSINFTNIPQTYTDLVLLVSPRDNRPTVQDSEFYIQFNANTNNYSSRVLYAGGSTPNSFSNSTYPSGVINSAGSTANTFGNTTVYIPNYAQNTLNKSLSIESVDEGNVATGQYIYLEAGLWANTSPITQITLTPFGGNSFVQYTTATLYGVFNADVSSAPATPTIGTATVTGPNSASVAFTGVSNAASYTATSTPDSITATSSSSPIYVTGLTRTTSYTFTVKANNPIGSSAASAASNSVTPNYIASYEQIATTTVGAGGTSTITFSNIPQYFTHLQLRGIGRVDRAGYVQNGCRIWLNSDTGSNYNFVQVYSSNGGAVTYEQYDNQVWMNLGELPSANASANMFGTVLLELLDYSNPNKFTTMREWGGSDRNGSGQIAFNAGLWKNTAAVHTISLAETASNWVQYTSFALYGIRSA